MINKCIFFIDYKDVVLEAAIKRNTLRNNIDVKYLKEAINVLASDNYRYYINRGITRTTSMGQKAKYLDGVPKYENDTEAAIEEFTGYLRNEAQILRRKQN